MAAVFARSSFLFMNSAKMLRSISVFGTSLRGNHTICREPAETKSSKALSSCIPLMQLQRQSMANHHGNHSTIWNAEKIISLALVGLFPVVIIYPNALSDYTIAALMVFHHYTGVEQVITDYARPATVGSSLATFLKYLNVALTFVVLFGLIQFSRQNMMFGNAVQLIWSLGNRRSIPRVEEKTQ